MTSLKCSEGKLRIFISKKERVTLDNAKSIIQKAFRIMDQNEAKSAVFENEGIIERSALNLLNDTFFNKPGYSMELKGI